VLFDGKKHLSLKNYSAKTKLSWRLEEGGPRSKGACPDWERALYLYGSKSMRKSHFDEWVVTLPNVLFCPEIWGFRMHEDFSNRGEPLTLLRH
jgi:hypothetical protein